MDPEENDCLLVASSGVLPCKRSDLDALVEIGYVKLTKLNGDELFEVTAAGEAYIDEMRREGRWPNATA